MTAAYLGRILTLIKGKIRDRLYSWWKTIHWSLENEITIN